jgi:glycosyltransferase involved in cell wall biosynthesis
MKSFLFDCERMKYPHTGPFNVCSNIGHHLLRQIHSDEKLTFLIDGRSEPFFGKDANYFRLNLLNKLYLPWKKSRFVAGTSQFDLWHSTYQSTMYHPLNKTTRVVQTVLDLNFLHEYPGDPKNKKRLSLVQSRVDRADHVVCLSQFGLDDIRKYLNLGSKRASFVYLGTDYNHHTSITEPVHRPAAPFLFCLGTVIPKKNFHVLPCLLQGNDFELIIAGINPSDYREKILEEAKRFNVVNRVRFVGPVSESEKTWYYKNCSAFLFPSLAEGFGLPPIEAMYHGKPVFLSTSTSLPEIGGDVAYYFSDFSPETMQQVFRDGMNDFNATHPEETIKAWASRFSWPNAAREYLKIYRSLI